MTRTCRSGLAALGALVLAASSADAAPVAQKAKAKPAVAQAKGKPVAVTQLAATKIRFRDRGSFNRPHPQSAWYALGLNKRFLKAGDSWVMAWSSMTRPELRKMAPGQVVPNALPWGPATYMNYQVTKVWQSRLGAGARTLATIRMTYGSKPSKTASTGAEITVDQFWNPVSFRVFSKAAPYGKHQDKDTRRVIHGVAEFPLYVGDLENVPGRAVQAPRVIPQLAKHRVPAGTTLAIKVANGVNVHGFTYWTPGRPYASFVQTQHHQGILVSQQLAR